MKVKLADSATVDIPEEVIDGGDEDAVQVTMTPEHAKARLEAMKNPRDYDPRWAERLAAAIQRNQWKPDRDDPILVDRQGQTRSGQHRLHAIVMAGKAVPVWIRFNAEVDDAYLLRRSDQRAWTFKQFLAMKGESNVTILQAAINLLWQHETGRIVAPSSRRNRGSNLELWGVLKRNGGIRESIKLARSVSKVAFVSHAAFVHYLVAKHHSNLAGQFIEALASGTMDGKSLTRDSAVFRIRERLMMSRSARRDAVSRRLGERDQLRLLIVGWNCLRAGVNPRELMRTDSAWPEIET